MTIKRLKFVSAHSVPAFFNYSTDVNYLNLLNISDRLWIRKFIDIHRLIETLIIVWVVPYQKKSSNDPQIQFYVYSPLYTLATVCKIENVSLVPWEKWFQDVDLFWFGTTQFIDVYWSRNFFSLHTRMWWYEITALP